MGSKTTAENMVIILSVSIFSFDQNFILPDLFFSDFNNLWKLYTKSVEKNTMVMDSQSALRPDRI